MAFDDPDCSNGTETTHLDFCVDAVPGNPGVHLHAKQDSTLTVNWESPPCVSTATRGFLGAASSPATPDQDIFQFEGMPGGVITVTLEPDQTGGYTGTLASLVLRQAGGGTLAGNRGAVPLELTSTLPEAGTYQIVVAESAPTSGEGFRGHYRLRVTSTSGATIVLEPHRSVEP